MRLLRYRSSYPAQAYLDSLSGKDGERTRTKFQALAEYMAEHGRLPTHAHGHWLEAPFDFLFEFKPNGHRLLAFRDGETFYVAHGTKKAGRKKQDEDYIVAANLRADFLEGMRAKGRKKPNG